MRCPECGQENLPGAWYCERCGLDLGELPETADEAVDEVPENGLTCSECGHVNRAEFLFCENCGGRLGVDATVDLTVDEAGARPAAGESAAAEIRGTRRIEPPGGARMETEPRPAPAAPPESSGQLITGPRKGKVKLVVEQGMVLGKQFLLTGDEILVGREDASENIYPDIDLSGLDEGYVHRRHARLVFEGSFLFVTHLGGHNRTYVNNRPIADHLACPLNVGDTVRFGKVLMRLVEV